MRKSDKVIRIVVQGGVVVEVEGLPAGWVYEVIDYDVGGEAGDLCNEGNCPHEDYARGR